MRLKDACDPKFEHVVSKWYYELEIESAQKLFIGLHQEDERIQGVVQRRPFLDVGITVLKVNADQSLELIEKTTILKERQVELEIDLQPGNYIILPRTTGTYMTKPKSAEYQSQTPLLDSQGNVTKIFEGVIEDIFRKFDLHIGRELSYDEFKIFYQCTGQ